MIRLACSGSRWALRGALALATLLALPACQMDSTPEQHTAPERVPIGGVSWYVDYDAAVDVAREQDKALWVHFGENPG